jgi:hypothetical protein
MTGGRSLICPGAAYRYTFGYELHCQQNGTISGPHNLEGGNNRAHQATGNKP